MIELRISKGARPTGELLLRLLRDQYGLEVRERPDMVLADNLPDAVVSYGVPLGDLGGAPVLNASAGRINKYEELERLKAAGILVPPFDRVAKNLQFPMLGRTLKHTRGKDIVPVLQNGVWLERLRAEGLCDFFTQFVPKDREFRVWSYRRRVLAVYEKILRYPHKAHRDLNIIWNWNSGYAFEFLDEVDAQVKQVGANAVNAMGLDFGAVDMILGQDGMLYTLEVNTAPGVEGPRQGLSRLAQKIARWAELGFPRRNRAEPAAAREVDDVQI